tara:strand:- start:319 stop:759 length:441 start_codon:yes stop_codon:yes gene_type:complete
MDTANKYEDASGVFELTQKDFKGDRINNEELRGKFGLLKVYAPWCRYCNDIVPPLTFLAKGLAKENFFIAAVNITNEKDNNHILKDTLNVPSFPTLFFVRTDGSLEKYESDDRSIETLLQKICSFTKKCCRKEKDSTGVSRLVCVD